MKHLVLPCETSKQAPKPKAKSAVLMLAYPSP